MGKIFVMQSLASSPVHKFPLKFTSNEINAPFSLNFFHHFNSIFPYRTAKSQGDSAGMEASCIFIHFFWKNLLKIIYSQKNTCGRKPPAVYEDLRHIRNS